MPLKASKKGKEGMSRQRQIGKKRGNGNTSPMITKVAYQGVDAPSPLKGTTVDGGGETARVIPEGCRGGKRRGEAGCSTIQPRIKK